MRSPAGGDVALHRIGGEKEDVAVATGCEHHGVRRVRLHDAGDKVASDNAGAATIDSHHVDEFAAVPQLDGAKPDLARKLLVSAEQQLLAGLPTCVERALQLRAAEAARVQQAAVLAGERHALSNHLVDDVHAHLCEPIHVGFASAEVAALDRVVEQPMHAVAIAAIVLGGVDSALRRDAVRAARRIVERENVDVVTKLGKRGCGRSASQATTNNNHLELALVVGVDQLHVGFVVVPLIRNRTARNLGVQRFRARHGRGCRSRDRFLSGCLLSGCLRDCACGGHRGHSPTIPASTANGNDTLPTTMIVAMPTAR